MAPPHAGHNLWTDDAQPPGTRRQHLRMMRSPGMATMSCEMMGGVDTMMDTGPAADLDRSPMNVGQGSLMMRCCFDKRVWIGLGVLAAGLVVFAPHLGWVALPVLAGLACPLSMLMMMRGMRQGATCAPDPQAAGQAGPGRAAEIARLRRDIDDLKHHASVPGAPAGEDDQRPAGAGPREALTSAHRDGDSGLPG